MSIVYELSDVLIAADGVMGPKKLELVKFHRVDFSVFFFEIQAEGP